MVLLPYMTLHTTILMYPTVLIGLLSHTSGSDHTAALPIPCPWTKQKEEKTKKLINYLTVITKSEGIEQLHIVLLWSLI
jgi:hypothetical protein